MASITKIITNSLNGLNPRQKEVITARFGLDGKTDGETLAAIAIAWTSPASVFVRSRMARSRS